jgi:hypothetical protein
VRWFFLLCLVLLNGCGSLPIQHVEGSVFVIEHGDGWELVSVETQAVAIALHVNPPYHWETGRCYRLGYYDPQTPSDGTMSGEPRAVSIGGCAE